MRAIVTDRPGSFQVTGESASSCEATNLAYAIRRIDDCTLAAIRPTERNARCWS